MKHITASSRPLLPLRGFMRGAPVDGDAGLAMSARPIRFCRVDDDAGTGTAVDGLLRSFNNHPAGTVASMAAEDRGEW